jgi:hypothetical protein
LLYNPPLKPWGNGTEEDYMTTIFAYLDAGTGSMILQALMGGVAGLLVGAKLFGRRVMSFLKFWKRDEAAPAASEPAPSSPVDDR